MLKKFWVILGVLVLLVIPILFLNGLVEDRIKYKDEAVRKISNALAGEQRIYRPSIRYDVIEKDDKNKEVIHNETYYPIEYKVNIDIDTATKKIGIFSVPTYIADVTLSGYFGRTDKSLKNRKVTFSFDISDKKGFTTSPYIKFADKEFNNLSNVEHGMEFTQDMDKIPFLVKYKIRGINKISIIPYGNTFELTAQGNWANPNFEGDFLPEKYSIEEGKFDVFWSIPGISNSNIGVVENVDAYNACNISLIVPVDNYRMAIRALKYSFLFLCLTFLSYFVYEIVSKDKRKIHPLQYILMGISLLIFYLLLVALSEFMSFKIAYLISALMTIMPISLYTHFVLMKKQNIKFSLFMTLLLAILYLFLYVLLMLQDFSLIIGSIFLFIVVSAVMFATRNVDWYSEN